MLYPILKDAHNLLRWLVILTALWALIRVWPGFFRAAIWEKKDRLAGLLFTSVLNLQFLLGLALLLIGPYRAAYGSMATTMKDPVLRFFTVEHPFMMFLAVLVAQAGFSLSKRASGDRAKFLRAAICYTIALLLILAAIPWKYSPLIPRFFAA